MKNVILTLFTFTILFLQAQNVTFAAPASQVEVDRVIQVLKSIGQPNLTSEYLYQKVICKNNSVNCNPKYKEGAKQRDDRSELEKFADKSSDDMISDSNCAVNVTEEEDIVAGEGDQEFKFPRFTIKVDGSNCPVYISVGMTGVKTGPENNFVVDMDIHYEFKTLTPEAQKHYQVVHQSFDAELKATFVQEAVKSDIEIKITANGNGLNDNGKTYVVDQLLKMNVNIDLGGFGGRIPFSFTEFQNNLEKNSLLLAPKAEMISEQSTQIDLQTEVIKFTGYDKADMFNPMGTISEYKLGDKTITKEQHEALSESIELPGAGKILGGEEETLAPKGFYCNLEVYELSKVSVEEINRVIKNGGMIFAQPLGAAFFSSTNEMSIFAPSGEIVIKAKFNYDFVVYEIHKDGKKINELFATYDDVSDSAHKLNDLSMRFKCDIMAQM